MKKYRILLPFLFMISGFVLIGMAWSINLGVPFNSICLTLGLGLSFLGLVIFVIGLWKNQF